MNTYSKNNFHLTKRSILFLWLPVLLFLSFSCKKDKDPVRQFLLSKVYEDGLLKTEYIYSADKKPLRRNVYGTNTGQSVFLGFRLYERSATGLLEDITDFNKNNSFNNKFRLQYDVNNRVTRMDDLANDNTLQYYYLFDYDPQGRLVKYTFYDAAPLKMNGEGRYTYNEKGDIATINRYYYSNNTPVKTDSATYAFGAKGLPKHWDYFEMLPIIGLPNGERTFFDMTCDSFFYYFVDAPPGKTNATFSAKEYNSAGYLIKQHGSYKGENLGVPVTTNFDMSYEYIE